MHDDAVSESYIDVEDSFIVVSHGLFSLGCLLNFLKYIPGRSILSRGFLKLNIYGLYS